MPSITKKRLEIVSNLPLNHNCYRLELAGDRIPAVSPGQFVQIEVPGKYLRRPISVHDASEDRIVLVYKTVGEGTLALSDMVPGQCLEVLVALGKGFDAGLCKERALLLGGGLGSAPLYLLAKELLASGKQVSAVLCFNTAADVVLTDAYMALGIDPVIVTMDGSCGIKGIVTDAPLPPHDCFYTCGPLPMMRAVCRSLEGPGQLSMEERMGCGAGFCYGCTIKTAGGPARVCADGPVFKKEDILW